MSLISMKFYSVKCMRCGKQEVIEGADEQEVISKWEMFGFCNCGKHAKPEVVKEKWEEELTDDIGEVNT